MDFRRVLSKCEDFNEEFLRRSKRWLPTVGRLLLLATFIEDGLRLLFNTSAHARHFSDSWYLNYGFSYCLTFALALLLLVVPGLVMLRVRVNESCGILACVLVMQVILYRLYSSYHLVCRNVSVLAALMFLVVENIMQKPKKYDPLPKADNDVEMTSLMLVVSRLFLNLMLVSMIQFDLSYKRLALSLVSYSMMVCVWCGYKTRLVSLALSVWLFLYNIVCNDFWNRYGESHVIRYDFFQTLSAVGGLLLLIHTGPGELSVDELKKKW